MAKWLIFCSFIFCLTMTLLGLILDLTFQLHYTPVIEKIQRQTTQSIPSYQEEKNYFINHPFFSQSKGSGKDFADYLRSRVSTDKNHVLITPQLQKTTLSLGKKWLEKRHLIKPSAMVEEIFNRIQTFSKWSVYRTLALNPKMDATEFIVASQIYIANSYYTQPDHLVDTLSKVRHMAFLLIGSESLNYKLAGLSILEKEKDLLDFMVYKKMSLKGSWELVKKNELDRYRKFLYKTYDLLSFLTPPQVVSQIFIKENLPIGFCSIYRERMSFISWLSPFLEPHFPFEPSFSQHFEVMARVHKKALKKCGSINEEIVSSYKIPLKANIPYYRRIFAFKVLLNSQTLGEGS